MWLLFPADAVLRSLPDGGYISVNRSEMTLVYLGARETFRVVGCLRKAHYAGVLRYSPVIHSKEVNGPLEAPSLEKNVTCLGFYLARELRVRDSEHHSFSL